MGADIWRVFPKAVAKMGDGTFDMDDDIFKCILVTSAYTPDATDEFYSDINGEVAEACGYFTGGKILEDVTWNTVGNVSTFDATDILWDAGGCDITARYAIIFNSSASNSLLAICLLDETPADHTAVSGESFVVGFNAAGIFDITSNWSA